MKNRWVQLQRSGHVCYGQIEDAGPGDYDDATYVFGTDNARPANKRFNGAGLDVSPALNGCLAFTDLNGDDDGSTGDSSMTPTCRPDRRKKIVTTSGVSLNRTMKTFICTRTKSISHKHE